MSASTRGGDTTNKEPEKPKKSKEEQEAWNKAALAYAQFYHGKFHLQQWQSVSNPSESDYYSAPAPTGAGFHTPTTLMKLLPDGLYVNRAGHFLDPKTKQPLYSVEIRDGVARPCGGPGVGLSEIDYINNKKKFIENFKIAYSETMDLLASGKGHKTIDLDLGHVNVPPSEYDRLRLEMLLQLAADKGLGVNPGAGIQQMIKQYPPFGTQPGVWDKIKGKVMGRDVTHLGQAEFFQKMGNVNAYHQQAMQTQRFELDRFQATLEGATKLEGENQKEKSDNYLKSILPDPAAKEEDKVKALIEASNKLDARLSALEGATRQIDSQMKALEARVSQAQTSGDLDALEKDMGELVEHRDALLESIEKEREDLRVRHSALDLPKLSERFADEQKAKLEPFKNKQEERLKKIESTDDVKAKTDDALKKITESINDKKQQVQAGPASPRNV